MAVSCVRTSLLPELIKKLTGGLPHTNTVRMIAKHARTGKLTANIYTDGWPDFTTTVCHILSPAVSDEGDVMGHSTCKEQLLHVIQESGVVSWSKEGWQLIDGFEISCADYLQANLKPPPEKEDVKIETSWEGVHYYLPGELAGQERACPEGFILGKLKLEHAVLVAPYWIPNAKDEPNTLRYFESMIRNYHNVAVYQADDPTKPIAWGMQHPNGVMAHGYVFEEFRRKGLNVLITRELCKRIIGEGVLPELFTDNPLIVQMVVKLGMIELCQVKSLTIRHAHINS